MTTVSSPKIHHNSNKSNLFSTEKKASLPENNFGQSYYYKKLCEYIPQCLSTNNHPVEQVNKNVRGEHAADFVTNINCRIYHIQVLPAGKQQDQPQWRYQKLVEQSGEYYLLVRSFTEFATAYFRIRKFQKVDYTKKVADEDEAVTIMTACETLAELKAFYLINSSLIDATERATHCYKSRKVIIYFKLQQHEKRGILL